MARREYGALSAALIICVFSVIALSVSAYVLSGKLATEQARALEAERKAGESAVALSEAERVVVRLKEIIGHAREAPLATVEASYRGDVAATMPPASLENSPASYRTLLFALLRATRSAVAREVEVRGAVDALRAQLAAAGASHEKQLAAEQNVRAGLMQEIKDVRAWASAEYKREHATWETLFVEFGAKIRELEQWQDRYHALAKRSAREIDLAQQRYGKMRTAWEDVITYDCEQPYGHIVEIDAVNKTVLIDVGSEDRLPRGLVFQVYDGEAQGARREAAKGRLEVTAILGSHLAQARLVRENLRDPLLRGDVVYTPAWRPGAPRQFALAGICDITGDGRDDHAYLQKLVKDAGGVVAADVSATGKRTGTLGIDIRFVIVGRPPQGASNDKQVLAYEKFLAEARELHIELVPLDKFLSLAGWPAPTQVVQLNSSPLPRSWREREMK